MISQSVPWDPSRFVGFTSREIELIRTGFFAALNQVYQIENEDTETDVADVAEELT